MGPATSSENNFASSGAAEYAHLSNDIASLVQQQTEILQQQLNAQQSLSLGMITLLATVLVAGVGWFVSLYTIKRQHQLQVRTEIYKQFVSMHKDYLDAVVQMTNASHDPFLGMELSLINYELQKDQGAEASVVRKAYFDGLKEAMGDWDKWAFTALPDAMMKLTDQHRRFTAMVNDWAAPLSSLIEAKVVFDAEFERAIGAIREQVDYIVFYKNDAPFDWEKWDKEDIKKRALIIQEQANVIGSYVHDFMVIIHNVLLSPQYGYKRETRKTTDAELKVLTKDGLITNVEKVTESNQI